MNNFNKFEEQTSKILIKEESLGAKVGDVLNKTQDALHTMTGDNLFAGPGFASNKYDSKKNYYPNIRGKFNLINMSVDKANQRVIEKIEYLKQHPPTGIVSTQYSPEFMENASKNLNAIADKIKATYAKMPQGGMNMQPVIDALKVTDSNNIDNLQDSQIAKNDAEFKNYNDYIIKQHIPTFMSMGDKAKKGYIYGYLNSINNDYAEWKNIVSEFKRAGGAKGRTDAEVIPNTKLTKNIQILRDLWPQFLEDLKGATAGVSQRGWTSGANLQSILIGQAPGTYKRRGIVTFTDEKAINPDVLKQAHEKIMVPLFLSKDAVLLYATPQQWESMSKGGLLYKGITGFGKQAYSAGQNAPRVSL